MLNIARNPLTLLGFVALAAMTLCLFTATVVSANQAQAVPSDPVSDPVADTDILLKPGANNPTGSMVVYQGEADILGLAFNLVGGLDVSSNLTAVSVNYEASATADDWALMRLMHT